jgi:hypothetical protein
MTVMPVRRVFVKMSAQEPSMRDGTVTWFVAGGLGGVKEGEGTWKHIKNGGGKGGTSEGSLALDRASTGVFMSSVSNLTRLRQEKWVMKKKERGAGECSNI